MAAPSAALNGSPPAFFALAGHAVRWRLLTSLARSDRRVGELCQDTGLRQSLVSYHLRRLRDAGIVRARRSLADGRDTYYLLDLPSCSALLHKAGQQLHLGLGRAEPTPGPSSGRPVRLLFLCTGNSARSQMAEAFARHCAPGQVEAYSAGSLPRVVHPEAVRAMDGYGIDLRGQQSHSLDVYAGQHFDYVITVCDRAREVCPTFPGGQQVHWSFPDPADAADDVSAGAAGARAAAGLSASRPGVAVGGDRAPGKKNGRSQR